MSHNTLRNYYTTISNLKNYHNYDIDTIESMLPFERDIYVDLLMQYLNEKEQQRRVAEIEASGRSVEFPR